MRIIAITDAPIATLEDARELRSGEIGEIIVRGPVVTKAYDALPEATAAAKIAVTNSQHLSPNTEYPTPNAQRSMSGVQSPATTRSPAPAAPWHRMGDCGTLDPLGRLWFCGRKAERVLAAEGPLFTEPCEHIFRAHPHVARCALIGLGVPGKQLPALVVQRRKRKSHPASSALSDAALAGELRALAAAHPVTAGITCFYFHKAFPVDVRHNAKIHRLTLARWAAAHPAAAVRVA